MGGGIWSNRLRAKRGDGNKKEKPVCGGSGRRLALLAIVWVACGIGIVEADGGGREDRLAFGGPEVLKLDWATRSLNVADLNGDGRNDLALANNDTGKINLIHQRDVDEPSAERPRLGQNRWRPELEDAPFRPGGISVGFSVFDLAVGDLNGDGRPDLAYTARDTPLTVRYQGEEETWTASREFEDFEAAGWRQTLAIRDVEGDGKNELVVMSDGALRIFKQDEEGRLAEPGRYYVNGKNPSNLLLADVTENGRLDVLYVVRDGEQTLVLREQQADGRLGAERRFPLERKVRRIRLLEDDGGGPPRFAAVLAQSGTLEFFTLEEAGNDGDDPLERVYGRPDSFPIFREGRESPRYALGDLTGDGNPELLVANPEAAEILLFPGEENGFGASRAFPSFSAISALSAGRFFETPGKWMAVLSAREETLGISRLDDRGRLLFPELLELGEGKPLTATSLDMNRDGFDELAVVMEKDDANHLVVARPLSRSDPDAGWEVLSRTGLSGARRQPSAIRELPVFGPERSGLILFVPREPPILLVSGEEAPFSWSPHAGRSTLRESFLKGVEKSEVSVFDLTGDGRKELLVGDEGFARAIRAGDDGLEVMDQFNARRSDDEVAVVLPLRRENGEVAELLFYVASAGEFQFLRRDADGVLRYRRAERAGSIDLVDWFVSEEGGEAPEWLFGGEDRFWFVSSGRPHWERVISDTYETELEDVGFSDVAGADLNGDGLMDLIAVDGRNHVVEIISRTEEGWESRSFWKVFEQNMHYQGRTGGDLEPREIVVADLTDDGLMDFAFLVHDRILIYPQEATE